MTIRPDTPMRRLLLFLAALMTVSAGSGAQAAGTTATPKPRGRGMEVRQYTLQVLTSSEAESLLVPFVPVEDGGGVWRSSGTVLTVIGTRRTLAVADSVLQSYDHPPVTLVLRFMLIEATDSAVTDPRIGEVDGELRRLLKFGGYRRLAEATSVVAETQNFTSTMAAVDRTEFTVNGGLKNVRDGRVGIGISLRSGTKGMMGVSTSPDTRQLLSTTLTVPLGQTVVLGTAAGDKGVTALILTVRPELAEGQASAPTVVTANTSMSAAKAVRNPPQVDTGTFAFRVQYGSATINGILHVFRDSLTVDSPYCTRVPHSRVSSSLWGSFNCTGMPMLDDFRIGFDAWKPRERSYWSGSYTKWQPSGRECVIYTTNKEGQSVCARWQAKMVEVTVRVGDKILVLPTSP